MKKDNWQQSHDKWKEVVRRTRKKRKWNGHPTKYGFFGWASFKVISRCGYCDSFSCEKCPLYGKNVCYNFPDCDVFLWRYFHNMNAPRTNWNLAIEQAETILKAIEEHGKELGFM
jgi:hypothetical protein